MTELPVALIVALAVGMLVLLLSTRSRKKVRSRARPSVPARPPAPSPVQHSPLPEDQAVGTEAPAPAPPPAELASLRLIGPDDLDEPLRQRIGELCAPLAEPHPLHQRVASGLEDPEEVTEVVSSDPGLTADVLRTVNSAAFALAEPINSVRHAVTFLGVNAVNGIIVRASLGGAGADAPPELSGALERIWRSAYVASTFAQLIAQELARPRPSVLATQALFFNVGDVVIVQAVEGAGGWHEDGVPLVRRIEAQQAACGLNGPLVGAALTRQWQLPESISVAIERAYLPLVLPPEEHPLAGEERIDNVLTYLAGRVGDGVAYRGLSDIGDLDLRPGGEPGTHHLRAHLEAIGYGHAVALLTAPAFRRRANRFLEPFVRGRQ